VGKCVEGKKNDEGKTNGEKMKKDKKKDKKREI